MDDVIVSAYGTLFVSITSVCTVLKFATACLLLLSMVIVHVAPVQSPLHPVNVEPEAADAVSVTIVPWLNDSEHTAPQLIPGGEDVTVPLPFPVLFAARVKLGMELIVMLNVVCLLVSPVVVPVVVMLLLLTGADVVAEYENVTVHVPVVGVHGWLLDEVRFTPLGKDRKSVV